MLIGQTEVVVNIENDEILRDCQEIYKYFECELQDFDYVIKPPNYPTFGPPPSPPPPPPPDEQVRVLNIPIRLSKDHHQLPLSDTVIIISDGTICAKVFALDTTTCDLYFVLNKRRKWRFRRSLGNSSGYAVAGNKVYFLGSGEYPDCPIVGEVTDPADTVDVEAYNLDTKEWVKNITKLNCPKPLPIVFVYDGKIYALEGPITYPLLHEHATFELLDPKNNTASAWTRLESLPIWLQGCCTGILHANKGSFFLKYEGESTLVFEYDLSSGRWTYISSDNLESNPVAQLLYQIPGDSFIGACMVEDILFTYTTGRLGNPEIVYYDLGDYIINQKGESIDLSAMFDGGYDFVSNTSTGYLNYLGDDKFSLVINTLAGGGTSAVWAMCCCTFELRKAPTRMTDSSLSKQLRLAKFIPKLICRKAYQVPEYGSLEFCQKLQ